MADWMRATVQSTLGPATATVSTRTAVRTPTGGTSYTWTPGGYSFCTLAPMTADEIDLAGRLSVRGTLSCRISANLDVDAQDRITIADAGADELDGVWEVTAVMTGFPMVDRLLYLARAA